MGVRVYNVAGEKVADLSIPYADTSSTQTLQWQVNDVATAELMRRFYRGMLHDKLRPAAALRLAQTEIARDPRWTSPYFWAGFALQGDWK